MNHITFGDIDTADLGIKLYDTLSTSPPEVKDAYVDLPGGDGSVDLTAASGGVRYRRRTMAYRGVVEVDGPERAEMAKTRLAGALHGAARDFTLSWDPGYTYRHGRAAVSDCEYVGGSMTFTITIVADPWKSASTMTLRLDARGGVRVPIENGTRSVCPTIEANHAAVVGYHGESWDLPPGAHRITDLWLDPGESELIVDTDPGAGESVWSDLGPRTWADLSDLTWAEVAIGSAGINDPDTWETYAAMTWADLADRRWLELGHPATESDAYAAYIQYERQYL